MPASSDPNKLTLYHSEAAAMGQLECFVKTTPQKSKYAGKPNYVVLVLPGDVTKNYNCENAGIEIMLKTLVGRHVVLEFTGRGDDASVTVVGDGAEPPQQPSTRQAAAPAAAADLKQQPPQQRTPAPKKEPPTQAERMAELRRYMVRQSNLRLMSLDAACYVATRHNKKHADFPLTAHDIRELSSVFYIGAERMGGVDAMPATPLPEDAAKGGAK